MASEDQNQPTDVSPPVPPPEPPTHAGGVVVRKDGERLRYLLVTAKTESEEWVIPKGRIEAGESAADAARREVLEEAGVEASVREPLDVIEFDGKRGRVRAQFFRMDFVREGAPAENRKLAWLPLGEALDALSFKSAQQLILQADALAKGQ